MIKKSASSVLQFIHKNQIFRLTIFVLTALSIFIGFRLSIKNKDSADAPIELKIMDIESRRRFGRFASLVNVGMILKNFTTFDVVKNTFIVDLTMWFEFFSDQVMIESISQFSFENGDIIKKFPPDVRINDNITTVKYDLRLSFKSNMFYKRFPIENHKISIILTNNFLTPSEMFFSVEDSRFVIDPSINIPDWFIERDGTAAGYWEVKLDEKKEGKDSLSTASPKVRFTMNLSRKGAKDAFVIFLPLYLVSFVSTYSFLTKITNIAWRYLMASTSLPALLGYRFVLQNLLPQVAYFTITDSIYLFLLLYCFVIFLFQTFFSRRISTILENKDTAFQEKAFKKFENINTIGFFISIVKIIAGTYYLLFWQT